MHIVADPRLVRRVIKRYRGIAGLGLEVPHGRSCLIDRDALLRLVTEKELGARRTDLEARVLLVARPEREPGEPAAAVRTELWRHTFHGHVHHHLDARVASGALTDAVIRERIDRIGQTEFDEIRSVLHGEELLFSVKDDREAYVEFAAFYLELRHFAPDALTKFFPTLRDPEVVEHALSADVAADELLQRCRPVDALSYEQLHASRSDAAEVSPGRAEDAPSRPDAEELLAEAARHRAQGNAARASILSARASRGGIDGAGATSREDLASLSGRLSAALHAEPMGEEEAPDVVAWTVALTPLVAAAAQADSTRAREARVLHDLQKICLEAERERRTVDVVGWAVSLGSRRVVRPLPVTRVLRIARLLHRAFAASHRARLDAPDRGRLEAVFHQATERAAGNVRRAVKPALAAALDAVGLRPQNVPETVAREKLSEEILDQILERGFLGIGQLRDALSRSNLKLPDLSARALVHGDPLLRADALLAESLDGVYRRGEIYLRALQKVSSLAFGTPVGRLLTLHLLLPLLAAFVFLEASSHLVHPLAHALGLGEVHVLTPASLGVLALLVYALLHSETARRGARAFFRGLGRALHAVFVAAPGWVLTRPAVVAVYRSAVFAGFSRLVLQPLALGGVAYLIARRLQLTEVPAMVLAGSLFAPAAVFLGTALGYRLQEAVVETVVRRLRALGRRVIPGALALLLDLFRALVEAVDRGIYAVDEKLTFKTGESTLSLVVKGAAGVVWFLVTYVLRIYVNLLIEPQVNPIKHFPVVTVSHKIILPMGPTLLGVMRQPLLPLGPVVANTIAGSTVFLLPGVFGFLVWELKGNWGLYDANRSRALQPARIGHHGETMNGLLVMGFHQGTLPKLYAKLRHAARRGATSVNRYREALHQVEHALHVFADRELAGLLRHSPRWDAGEVVITTVDVSSNRVRLGVTCGAFPGKTAFLHFEEQSGLLVASVAQAGFVDALGKSDRHTFETALAGLYKLAGVDIVREQVEALLGPDMPYDIADEGLLVWPDHAYGSEIVYDLTREGTLEGKCRGEMTVSSPKTLSARDLVFRRQVIGWREWTQAWVLGAGETVVSGPPILRAPAVTVP